MTEFWRIFTVKVMSKIKRAPRKPKLHPLHKIIFCIVLFVGFALILLSPWADFNPDWLEPVVQRTTNDLDELPGIKGVPERLIVLTTVDGTRYVNGKKNPTMHLRPGQTVRLEVVNTSADDIYNLAIPGYMLHVISRDEKTLDQVDSVANEHLAPGQRVQILFTPVNYGMLPVKSLHDNHGFSKYGETTFMKIRVQGFPMIATALPDKLIPYNTRALTLSLIHI